MDHARHTGKQVIVTGSASGIGHATALRFLAEGARVTACDVSEAGLDQLVREAGATSERLSTVVADITRQSDVDAVCRGAVDVLANVAGMMDHFVPVHRVDDELWDRVLAVNVTGAMRMCRAVLPGMLEVGTGAIVNVASRAALLGGVAGAAYVASKHALLGLTRSIAATYAPNAIRCNAVCPGAVATGIGSTADPHDPADIERWLPLLGTATRIAEPDEIAAVISWLASDEAGNVNGGILTADGGWSAL
jgi:NAD(P)-dependent dehydrogenase (short-subunit alcohol dehydrogenase family)